MAGTDDKAKPLAGLRVLDLTLARAGPNCARHLADWGADVISVQPPGAGVDLIGSRDGFDYQNLHRNKRAIGLDLKSGAGHAAFLKLAKTADVLVENMRPDVKHRLKISYDDLAPINPRLVYGSISGFGQDGPYGHRAGVDQIAQGLGGLMSITGAPGGGPMRVGIAISDMAAGTLLALGIMMALYERERTGEGVTSPPRCWRASSSCWISRPPAGSWPARFPANRATTTPPRRRWGRFRPPTATSTSPPPRQRNGSASVRRSAARTGLRRTSGAPLAAAPAPARR